MSQAAWQFVRGLLEPIGESSPIAKHLERRGPGLHHICIRVSDIRSAMAGLAERGYRLLSLVGMMMDYMLPKKVMSWKEAWEIYFEQNGGALFEDLERYGLRMPKYWEQTIEGKEHISHQAWAIFYNYTHAAAFHTWIPEDEELQQREITVEVGGRRFEVKYWSQVIASTGSGQRPAPRRKAPKLGKQQASGAEEGLVVAPMQGTIVKVHHAAGESVRADEPVCVLEAMKMENEIKAPVDGDIVDLRVQAGDTVTAGAILMIIK